MATQNLPLSAIIKAKNVEEPKKRTREDWRKAKELEEARKAGTAPAAVDEEGRDINPHIPQYIAQSPWYFGSQGPTLKHQRPQPEKQKEFSSMDEWYTRGTQNATIMRFRKGSCENCGAMTHKKKDCMERPRKIGAQFTGDKIANDEFAQPNLNLDYDGKRDRWNGYNPEEHKNIIEEFAKIEEAKRQLKVEKLKNDLITADGLVEKNKDKDSDDDEDEDKYVDDVDMPGTKVDSKQRITVRNLRIREDTAKYLQNLDPNSAYYDPKTRSMRDNPNRNVGKTAEEVQYAGDNFIRYTGDTQRHAKAQLFAWEAYEKGVDVHLLAEPTKLELLNQEFDKRKDSFKNTLREGIVDKYGGSEYLEAPPKELLLAQTEDYVEYSRHGKIIKGQEKLVIRSKYKEDVYINNHTSVWGSYWKDGKWGYKCCYSFIKSAYCTGESGRLAAIEMNNEILAGQVVSVEEAVEEEEEIPKTLLEQHQEKLFKEWKKERTRRRKKKRKGEEVSSSSSGEDEDQEEREKAKRLKIALKNEMENQKRGEKMLKTDERKNAYNSMYDVKAPTEEEMEAYFMKKRREDDPMFDFLEN